jgi:hypothetical protein
LNKSLVEEVQSWEVSTREEREEENLVSGDKGHKSLRRAKSRRLTNGVIMEGSLEFGLQKVQ